MANEAIMLTGKATGGPGNLPFLLYRSPDNSKKQPLIIFLHGAGEGSPGDYDSVNGNPRQPMANRGLHNTTTVRMLEAGSGGSSQVGPMTQSKLGAMPTFIDPITGEDFHYNMIAPQQYYNTSGMNGYTGSSTSRTYGILWPALYVTEMIAWAKANLPNLDHTRIYLTGLSLGGGGTVTILCNNQSIRNQIAAAAVSCPGYGHTAAADQVAFAKSGIPLWMVVAKNDGLVATVTPTIASRINGLVSPIRSPRVFNYNDGGHAVWYRLFNYTDGVSYPGADGKPCVHNISMFRWLLQYTKKDAIPPIYL